MDIETAIKKYPRLNFLRSPAFTALPEEKREFLLGCVEDALFWVEREGQPEETDLGFRFLAAHYGLEKAKEEADAKGLRGREREMFLKPIHDLYLMYSPQGPTAADSN